MKPWEKFANRFLRKGRWKRLVAGIAGAFVLLVVLVCILFTPIVRLIIQHEVRVQLEAILNAQVEIDDLQYHPFLSVSTGRIRLVSTDASGNPIEVAELGGLTVNLAKLPLGGPILVDDFELLHPVICLTRLAGGRIQLSQPDLLRSQPGSQSSSSGTPGKISDLLQVRHFKLSDLTVQVTDESQPNSPTTVLAHLNANANLSSGTGGYQFHADLTDEPLTALIVDGSIDVDQYQLTLSRLTVSGRLADDRALAQLPQSVQEFCRRNGLIGVGGDLSLDNGAMLSFDASSDHWKLSNLSGDFSLSGQNSTQTVDGRVHFTAAAGGPVPAAGTPIGLDYLGKLDADSVLAIQVDPRRKVTLVSQEMPQPITEGDCDIRFADGKLAVNQLSADYGKETIQLKTDVNVSGDRVRVSDFQLLAAGGTVAMSDGEFAYADPHPFNVDVTFEGIDLSKVDQLLRLNSPQGITSGRMVVSGSLPEGGPVVIEEFDVSDPTISLTRLADGSLELSPLIVATSNPPTAPPASSAKITDAVQLHHFKLTDLTVKVTDQSQPESPTTVWAQVNASADQGSASSAYQFHLDLADKPLTELAIDGAADLNQYQLSLSKLSVSGRLADDPALRQLPMSVQNLCRQYGLIGVGGELSVDNGMTLSFDSAAKHWKLSNLSGDLTLSGQNSTQTVDGRVHFSAAGGGPLPTPSTPIGLDYLNKLDSDSFLAINADPQRKITLSAQEMPQPISQGDCDIRYQNDNLAVNNLGGMYGQQSIRLKTNVKVLGDRLEMDDFQMQVAGGTVQIGQADLAYAAPHPFQANITFDGIDLAQVKQLLLLNDPQGRLSGTCGGQVNASGVLPQGTAFPLDKITADGSVHAENGDFFTLPVLSDVAGKVNPDFKSAGQVGNAAGVFTLSDGTLHLSSMAASCPVIGVQGYGDVGVDAPHKLNMNLVVAPLGGVQQKTQQIPVLGSIFGHIESAITNVSQTVLYSFLVTGDATKVNLKAIPAPALTEHAQGIFGAMTHPQNLLRYLPLHNQDKPQSQPDAGQ